MLTNDPNEQTVIVCLHGSAGSSASWQALRAAARGRARVIAPDLVGYGEAAFDCGRPHSLQDEVDAVMRQIPTSCGRFHLVGHSFGGAVATYLAKRYPERVASLIVYEPVIFPLLFAEGLHTAAAQEARALRMAYRGRGPMSRWRFARQFIAYWASEGAWRRMSIAARRRLVRYVPKIVAEFDALAAIHAEMSSLRDLGMPVRVLCGTRTPLATRRIAELMTAQIDDARLLRLVNLGHDAPATRPQLVNPIILDYILPVTMPEAALAA